MVCLLRSHRFTCQLPCTCIHTHTLLLPYMLIYSLIRQLSHQCQVLQRLAVPVINWCEKCTKCEGIRNMPVSMSAHLFMQVCVSVRLHFCQNTYSEVRERRPLKASSAMSEIWFLLRSLKCRQEPEMLKHMPVAKKKYWDVSHQKHVKTQAHWA